jgi:hypothetical protein
MKKSTNPGLVRAGNPEYADHQVGKDGHYKPSSKLTEQSAGAKRAGDNRYMTYPDAPAATDAESTGQSGAGSKSGTRGSIHE